MVLERKLSWNCFKNDSIFFHLSPTSGYFHPLQVENCESNSRLVVDENDHGKYIYSIFFHLSPTSGYFHPLQVENCESNSRLVVDENDHSKFRLERVEHT